MNRVVNTSREVRFTVTIALNNVAVKLSEYSYGVLMKPKKVVRKKHLKEEILEEVGGVDNDENEHSG